MFVFLSVCVFSSVSVHSCELFVLKKMLMEKMYLLMVTCLTWYNIRNKISILDKHKHKVIAIIDEIKELSITKIESQSYLNLCIIYSRRSYSPLPVWNCRAANAWLTYLACKSNCKARPFFCRYGNGINKLCILVSYKSSTHFPPYCEITK